MQFDWRYIYGRSLVLVDDATGDPRVDLSKLGRFVTGGGELVERELNSGAFGNNKFTNLATPGVLQLDLLQVFRKEHKLDSFRFVESLEWCRYCLLGGGRNRTARSTAHASAPVMTATSPADGG